MINLDSTINKSGELLATDVDGELVMMNIETGKYYGMNTIGAAIWKMIEEPIDVTSICEELEKKFEVDSATCEKEVLNFLHQMESEDMIHSCK